MRVAMYLRVSTDRQSLENQRADLLQAIAARGWTLIGEYADAGISGSKGRDKRPAFDKMQRDAVRGVFDVVAAWSVDRLGRSLQDLCAFLGEIHGAGRGIYLHQQALDTTTPSGRAMFQMLGVFAEFERSIIVDRVKAGMARAKAQGRHVGRPPVSPVVCAQVRELRAAGRGVHSIRKELGIGAGSVSRIIRGN